MLKKIGSVVRRRAVLGTGATVMALAAVAAPSYATGTATYDISPVTSSLTSDLTSNIPVILGAVGALIALTIAVRMVRKFVKA